MCWGEKATDTNLIVFGLTWGAFVNSKSESFFWGFFLTCFRIRIQIPRFIINVKIMILNQVNRRSSMIQFETKMVSCVLYRSHLWNHLKWITTFLFHINMFLIFKKIWNMIWHDFANKMHPLTGVRSKPRSTAFKENMLTITPWIRYGIFSI